MINEMKFHSFKVSDKIVDEQLYPEELSGFAEEITTFLTLQHYRGLFPIRCYVVCTNDKIVQIGTNSHVGRPHIYNFIKAYYECHHLFVVSEFDGADGSVFFDPEINQVTFIHSDLADKHAERMKKANIYQIRFDLKDLDESKLFFKSHA